MAMMMRLRQASATNGGSMRLQRWHASLVLILCIVVSAEAFANPVFSSQLMRGGDTTAEEDQQIDEYIEDLIASIDSSSQSSSEDIRDDTEVVETDGIIEETGRREGQAIEEVDVIHANSDAELKDDEEEHVDAASEKDRTSSKRKEANDDEVKDVSVSKEAESDVQKKSSSSDKTTTAVKRKGRGMKRASFTLDEETTTTEDLAVKLETTPSQQPLGPARPNALYRFLLNQGRIGHVVVMICVLVVEFINTFIPPLAHFLAFIFSFFPSPDESQKGGSYRQGTAGGPVQKVNAQYAAFVSSDGTSVRGKQRKKAVRKADEQAAEKLRRVGSVQEAKFRHVSEDFMKRHRIGSYRDAGGSDDLVVYKERGATLISPDGDEESDMDWVVQALSQEDEQEEKPTSPLETSFGVGLGSEGATISVGVQFGSAKKKKRRKTIAEVATERTPIPKKRRPGPRTSDRDGGGGVIGRIRAAGANSLVSRSLLGAYPGDAVPPSEAGSANGVIALAEKYGYGDWSDNDENEGYDNDLPLEPLQRKVKKRAATKLKRSKSSSGGGVSIQLGLSSSDATRSRSATTRKRPTSTRRNTESIKDPVPTTEKSEILTGRPESTLPERKRVEVRPPMEKLNLAMEKAKRRKDEEKK